MGSVKTRAVLAVDDDPAILEVVRLALEDGGFRAKTAAGGAEALPFIEEASASLDALITDVSLGDGLDGWELARRGREANAALAVVYMSGAHGDDWPSKGVPKSILLQKPFAPAQVVTAVATLINEMQAPGPG